MPTRDDLTWFKSTFEGDITPSVQATPFNLDFVTAIAAQETGDVWPILRRTLSRAQILQLCVGDTLDQDRGRKAFPRTKVELVTAPQGQAMFDIAHQALVDLAVYIPSFATAAKKPHKFCHAFGIFQVDLQYFKTDPDFFLRKQWFDFGVCLEHCLDELHAAAARAGLAGKPALTNLEQVYVAIAYNAGKFDPAKGLKQGHFDGTQYYGERIFDLLRLAQTTSTTSTPAAIAPPLPGSSAIAAPTPVASSGITMQVRAASAPLLVRREPRVDAGVVSTLPGGHLVKVPSLKPKARFAAVETSLNGAYVQGFVAVKALAAVDGSPDVPVLTPSPIAPRSGIVAVYAPRRTGEMTRRTDAADAHSLNEPNQPGRTGTTPQELRQELATIIDYLGVDKAVNLRYQPRPNVTFCNIYAHDYCYLAGVYLPRVWWTPDAIERLAQERSVEPLLGSTIDEQRANDLFRWLRAFGPRFGWRQTGSLTTLQTEINAGAVGLIVARRKDDGRSGHILAVVPETNDQQAKRDAGGAVIAPLQSQAGTRNFKYGTGASNWWLGAGFADSAFWIHP